MPTSNYSVTGLQIIDSALRVIGVLRSGDTAANDSAVQADCLLALNLMLKNFQNYGLELWTRKKAAHTLTAATASYNITSFTSDIPERILQAYLTESGSDTEVEIVSMYEYWKLTNKTASGNPNQIAYDFNNTSGTLYVWPLPADSTHSLSIVYHKPYNDFDSATDAPDVPQRWFEALKWQLAIRLAPEFGRTTTQEMLLLASTTLDNALDAGYEESGVVFQPKFRY